MPDLNVEIPAFETPMDMTLPGGKSAVNCPKCTMPFNWPATGAGFAADEIQCPHCGVLLKIKSN